MKLEPTTKEKKEVFPLGFHKNVSILLKLVSFPFVSFLGWCDLSRACLDPEVPTGTFLLFPSLDCPAFHLVFRFRHAVCSLSHSLCYWDFCRTFYLTTVPSFPAFQIGLLFSRPSPLPYLVSPFFFLSAVAILSQELIILLCSLG